MLMSLISGKARLFIEYGLIAAIVLTSGMVVTLWLQKQHMQVSIAQMGQEITAINLVNTVQEGTITNLLEYREKDASAIKRLLEQEQLSDRAVAFVNNKLNTLERENENVRNFLSLPIPHRLCDIARDCGPNTSHNNSPKASSAAYINPIL